MLDLVGRLLGPEAALGLAPAPPPYRLLMEEDWLDDRAADKADASMLCVMVVGGAGISANNNKLLAY